MVSLLSEANDLGTGFCRISSEDSNTFVEIDKFFFFFSEVLTAIRKRILEVADHPNHDKGHEV